jgi:hypothetical protein
MVTGCLTTAPKAYKGKNHPYRVLMRDMKPHYGTLEDFAADASFKDDALAACTALQALGNKGARMKPGFLKPDQIDAHQQLFREIAAQAAEHADAIRKGQINDAQGAHKALSAIKKRGHTDYKDQAKDTRGPDPEQPKK